MTHLPAHPAETKRSEFPRFYFVSDPTLLEILSLGSDPPSVVPHFQSGLFDSLSNVTFDKVGARTCLCGTCMPVRACMKWEKYQRSSAASSVADEYRRCGHRCRR